MTRLEQLKERAEALPRKRAHTDLVSQLQTYGEALAEVRRGLAALAGQRQGVEQVFPEVDLSKFDNSVRDAARSARGLRMTLLNNLQALTTAKVEERVRKLKDAAKSARAVVKERWQEGLRTRLGGLEPIVIVARDAKLTGGEAMARQLEVLRSQAEPPVSPHEAEAVDARLRELAASVTTLGLKGATGAFLQNAVQGRARAGELENPEVRALLDQYKLWDRLSIKLG